MAQAFVLSPEGRNENVEDEKKDILLEDGPPGNRVYPFLHEEEASLLMPQEEGAAPIPVLIYAAQLLSHKSSRISLYGSLLFLWTCPGLFIMIYFYSLKNWGSSSMFLCEDEIFCTISITTFSLLILCTLVQFICLSKKNRATILMEALLPVGSISLMILLIYSTSSAKWNGYCPNDNSYWWSESDQNICRLRFFGELCIAPITYFLVVLDIYWSILAKVKVRLVLFSLLLLFVSITQVTEFIGNKDAYNQPFEELYGEYFNTYGYIGLSSMCVLILIFLGLWQNNVLLQLKSLWTGKAIAGLILISLMLIMSDLSTIFINAYGRPILLWGECAILCIDVLLLFRA